MGSLFGELAGEALGYAEEEEEEDPFDPFRSPGDIPYAPPVYGPPAPTGGINPNQGGFRDPVYNPANVQPGPNADFIGPAFESLGIREPVANFLDDLGLNEFAGLPTFNIGPYGQVQTGGSNLPIGQGVAEFVPDTPAEIALTFAPVIGDVPIDDVFRSGRGAVDNIVRGAMPEPSLFPGYSAGVPPMNPLGGENVFGPGVHGGGLPTPPATQPDELMDVMARSIEARGGTPPFTPEPPPAPYPSMPEGTMGEMFPDVVREQGLDPNSPAARMGAPLAYDPQFMGPPPGVEYDPIAEEVGRAWENSRRQEEILTGGGAPPPLSGEVAPPASVATPPPASTLPGVAGTPPTAAAPSPQPGVGTPPPPTPPAPPTLFNATPGGPPPIGPQVQQAAQAAGLPPSLEQQIAREWTANQRVINGVYSSPQGIGRVLSGVEAIAHAGEGAFSGNLRDSFINNVLSERTVLENQLAMVPNLTEADAQKIIDFRVDKMINDHYKNNPVKVQDALKQVADYEDKTKYLNSNVGVQVLSGLKDAAQNTVAGIADFGVIGVNGLVEMAQGGPLMAVGGLLRAADTIATALHHPGLLDFMRTSELPNIIEKEGWGIPFRYSGEGFRTGKDSPTLLGVLPKYNPLAPIDKYAIQPVINANTKLQFEMIQGVAKNWMGEGAKFTDYVRTLLANLPSQGFDGAVATAKAHIQNPQVKHDIGRFVRNATSSTPRALAPGRNLAENLLTFSAPFTRAQPARMADLFKFVAPGASSTQRTLAATAIVSNAIFAMAIYKVLNDKFGTTDPEMDPTKRGYLTITLEDGTVVNLAPQQAAKNALVNSIKAIADGNPEDIKRILFQAGVGRESLLASAGTRALGYGWDTQGNFYSPWANGGAKMPMEERLKASAPVPFTAQGVVFDGQSPLSLKTGLQAAGINVYEERKSNAAFRQQENLEQLRTQALQDTDLLARAFPNNPVVARELMGRDPRAVEWHEWQAIINAMSPEQKKTFEDTEAAWAAANKDKPTAVGNAIAIRKDTDIKEDARIAETKTKADALYAGLMDGSVKPQAVASGVSILKDLQNEDLAKIRWAGSTTYTGLPWKDKEGLERLPDQFETALQQYRNLGANLKEVPDGKGGTRFDFDGLTRAQASFMTIMQEKDPTTKARLDFYLQDRTARNEANKPELFKLYDNVSARTQEYWRLPTGTGEKTEWLRSHPMEDALLNMVGWMPTIHSPEAAKILIELTPGRTKR